MEIAFWISFVLIFYIYLGYALILLILYIFSRRSDPKPLRANPFISVLIPIHNGAGFVAGKLRSIKDNGYPLDKMEILIGLDACNDGSLQEVMKWEKEFPHFKVFNYAQRINKGGVLNRLASFASGTLFVFTDVRQRLKKGAIRSLIEKFSDSSVGVATGELMLLNSEGGPEGLGLYWKFEKVIRYLESEVDSVCGATGALYVIRRNCVPKDMPDGVLLDDVYLPMNAVKRGKRVLFCPDAVVYDMLEPDTVEFRRKVRTLLGNWQLIGLLPWLLDPFQNRIFFQYFSHKVLRLISPLCLMALYASSVFLCGKNVFYEAFFIAQNIFYAFSAAGFYLNPLKKGVLGLPYSFVLLNIAAWIALSKAVRNDFSVDWR